MQKVLKLTVCLLLVILNFRSIHASTLDKAEAAYSSGNYQESSALYLERALDRATSSPNASVFHNLGLSFARQKQMGLAVAAYLRAVQLRPAQADFRYNLDFLLKQSGDKLEANFPEAPWQRAWSFPALFFGEREIFYAGIVTLLIFSGFLTFRFYRKPRSKFILIGLVFSGIGLIAISLGLTYKLYGENDVGAVVVPKLSAYSGPTESIVIFELHEGAPFEILKHSGEWIKIRLSDQKQGWVKSDAVASFGRDRVLLPEAWKRAS